MKKPAIQSLLTAAVISSAGTFALAQQDPQLRVERQGEDRAVISVDREQTSRSMAGETRTIRDHSVRGTVVSLETYLRDGADAARSANASTVSAHQPKAILGDDGQVYLLLHAPQDSSVALDTDGEPGSLEVQRGTAATTAERDTTATIGTRTDADTRVRVSRADREDGRRDVNVGTDAERNSRETLSTDVDKDGLPNNGATRSERVVDGRRDTNVGTSAERNSREVLDTDVDKDALPSDVDKGDRNARVDRADRTTRIERNADADTQVYGMADADADRKARKHAKAMKHLNIGEQVTLRGDVYERGNIRGILVDEIQTR